MEENGFQLFIIFFVLSFSIICYINKIAQINLSLFQQMLAQQQSSESTWSFICAIIYTVAWSVSFYGQIYQNYKLKNVEGFSLDYLVLNMCGYTLYGIYSSIGFFSDIKGAGTVLVGDLIFVYHAIPMVIIQTIQCAIYPKGKNKISRQAIILAVSLWVILIIQTFLTTIVQVISWTEYWNPVSALGYGKLVISFTKYSPAVYWNYKRKSTKGWSIFNIILDLVGGTFSLMSGSISVQNGLNFTKLMLAVLTIFYDIIFVFQHYVLYRPKRSQNELVQQNEQSNITTQAQSNQQIKQTLMGNQVTDSQNASSNKDIINQANNHVNEIKNNEQNQ